MTVDVRSAAGGSDAARPNRVCLLNGPYVVCGGPPVTVADGSKRLLTLVALRDGRIERRSAARLLWPHLDDVPAAGRLRTALWRLRAMFPALLLADKDWIALAREVEIDIRELSAWADRLIDGTASPADLTRTRPRPDEFELLPDWSETWVILARERIRQRLLHGMEALSGLLVAAGRGAEAVDAAMLAVSVDPLRESAVRALMSAHLADGNVVEAQRSYETFGALLSRELGLAPSADLTTLLPAYRRHH